MKVKRSIYIEAETLKLIEEAAKKEDRSINYIVDRELGKVFPGKKAKK